MINDSQQTKKDLEEPLLPRNEGKRGPPSGPPGPPPLPFGDPSEPVTYGLAIQRIFALAIWPILGMMLHPAYHIVNSIILGRSPDPVPLAALGLGGTTLSIFLLSLGVPFISVLDTLIAQAFGQRDLRLCWVYLNRQLYLTTFIFLPICVLLFIFCEMAFLAMGQDPETSRQAAIFVRICIPGVMCSTWAACFGRFLGGQRVTQVGLYSNIGGTVVHVILAYFLAVQLNMQMYGIAIASSIQFFVRFIITIGYIKVTQRFQEGYVSLFHEDSKKNLWEQFIMSLQAASLGIWGWWAFDIFTIMASYMSVNDLAAQTVLRNIGLLCHMIPVGISQAASIFTGNMIGAKNIQAGRIYAQMCTLSTFVWAVGSIFVINLLKQPVVLLFSSAPVVNEIILSAFGILSFFVFFDCVQGVGAGIIKGLGKQGSAAWITLVGWWVLGIPISLIFVFYLDWGMFGLWTGPCTAHVFNFINYYILIWTSDWHKISDDADKRRQKERKI